LEWTRNQRRGHAAHALMPVEEFGDRGPALILAAGELRAKKKVILSRGRVEGGIRRRLVDLSRKGRRNRLRNLGGSEVLAALDNDSQPTGRVQTERRIPTGQTRPVTSVEKTGFGVGAADEKLEARIAERRR